MLGGIQPDRIRALADNVDDDGLLQRFMPVLINQRGRGVDEAPDQGLKAEAEALGLALARSEPNRLFKFAPEADAERLAIEDFALLESERPNAPAAMKQWLCKTPNEFGRLALVFHAIECLAAHLGAPSAAIPELVSRETAHRAYRFLMEFVFHHAQAFYGGVIGSPSWSNTLGGLPALSSRDVGPSSKLATSTKTIRSSRSLNAAAT